MNGRLTSPDLPSMTDPLFKRVQPGWCCSAFERPPVDRRVELEVERPDLGRTFTVAGRPIERVA